LSGIGGLLANADTEEKTAGEPFDVGRFVAKLGCRCFAGNAAALAGNGDRACDRCGRTVSVRDGVIVFIPPENAFNVLEKADYDAAHGVDIATSRSLSRLYANHIPEELGNDLDVVEIGSGTGLLTASLGDLPRVGQSVALDISLAFLRTAHQRVMEHSANPRKTVLACADLNDLPFGESVFDVVVGNSILHHIMDYGALLSRLRFILKDGGVALFSEPCQQGKSLVAFFLGLMVQHDRRSAKPVLDEGERKRIEGAISVLMRERNVASRPELKLKMEDKHIFMTGKLAEMAADLGYAGFQSRNTSAVTDGYRKFAENTLRVVGLHDRVAEFSFLFEEFQDKYLYFFADQTETPHQILIFRK
jgi:ubiquinone/menaquinone biosynthesis C-methylase UbiE